MMENKLVLKRKNSHQEGTRLIPVPDVCSALSAEAIGSHYSQKLYRKLNEVILFEHLKNVNPKVYSKTTDHNEPINGNKEQSTLFTSPPLSPERQRKILISQISENLETNCEL